MTSDLYYCFRWRYVICERFPVSEVILMHNSRVLVMMSFCKSYMIFYVCFFILSCSTWMRCSKVLVETSIFVSSEFCQNVWFWLTRMVANRGTKMLFSHFNTVHKYDVMGRHTVFCCIKNGRNSCCYSVFISKNSLLKCYDGRWFAYSIKFG